MEARGYSYWRQWWVRQIKLSEALTAVAVMWSVAAEARQRDGGLWQRHVRLTVCVTPWLTADSSQYLILGMDPRFKARRARDKRKIKSKKFTTASIYVEFKSFLLKKKIKYCS